VIVVGGLKLYNMYSGNSYRLVTDSPYFYLALTSMLLGTQLFLAGFLGELIIRHSNDRNHYEIGEEIMGDTVSPAAAIEARRPDTDLANAISNIQRQATVEAQ